MKWYKINPERYAVEKRLLGQRYPQSRIIKQNGILKVEMRCRARKDDYLIKAVFSDFFPNDPMKVYIKEPRIHSNSPHCFKNGLLCLHAHDDVGPQTTAVIYLDWARQWIKHYENWLDGINWPDTNWRSF